MASGTGTIIDESVTGVKMLELQEGSKYVLWGKKIRQPPTIYEMINIPPGSYATEEALLAKLNVKLAGKCVFELENVGTEKYFRLSQQDANKRVVLANGLHDVLGYNSTTLKKAPHRAERKADLVRHSFVLFLYCDVVEDVMVGPTKVPLLRTVHLSQSKRGEVVNHLYQPGIYVSVNKSQISVIGVDLRNDRGGTFSFHPQAKVMLTLHFKRDFDYVSEPPLLPPLTHYDTRRIHIQ